MSKKIVRNSSISEKPIAMSEETCGWINSAGVRKVHSLVDKVYKQKNLYLAWVKVKATEELVVWTE